MKTKLRLLKAGSVSIAAVSLALTTQCGFAAPVPPSALPGTGTSLKDILGTNSGSTSGTAGGLGGTFTYSASSGQNNNFAVGTSTSLGVNASASSTADYKVQSTGTAAVGGSSLTLGIGSSSQIDSLNKFANATSSTTPWWVNSNSSNTNNSTQTATDSGVISGKFNSVETLNTSATMKQIDIASGGTGQNLNDTASVGSLAKSSNTVEVTGISNASGVKLDTTSKFSSDIGVRNTTAAAGTSNSATANGSSGLSLNTSATANSSNSAYTSTFIQAF